LEFYSSSTNSNYLQNTLSQRNFKKRLLSPLLPMDLTSVVCLLKQNIYLRQT